ncbi:MAG: DUF262 domain-containing protein, partial [Candidatus Roizmanbacteria bacterium]|nr:DUF262 domain-containing protein [Candidatus Roizmanbacteria bacterium]
MANSTTTIKEIKTSLEGIGHVLSDRQIAVPAHQRSYAWEERQVTDLFHDLDDAMKEEVDEYFLGSIVVIRDKSDSDRLQLLDGQQRLATTTILLAAMRDYFWENTEKERAETIESKYLFMKDLRSQELIPRLRLNQIDHDFFTKHILSKPDSKDRKIVPSKDSHERITRAAELAKEHINAIAKVSNDAVNRLIDIVDYIDSKIPVICVEVPDHANAFRIFETLNDRGLDLAISDLLKNYLFHLSDNRIDETQDRWISMLGTLDTVGGEGITVQYIRHFWSSKYGLTRERDLYDKIKQQITSKQKAINFATELADNAKMYAAIINTDHEIWTTYGSTTKTYMATLNLMGMIQIRPLLLSILRSFTPAEVKNSLKMFVSWATRFLIVGGLGGGTLENYYSDLAKTINEGKIKTASQLA